MRVVVGVFFVSLVMGFHHFCFAAPFVPSLTGPYRLDQVEAWVKSQSITSVESFIANLPAEHLSHFTLMSNSGSLQASTPDQPRAILYGDDAQWIVTFNGSAQMAGGNTIEMMFYNSDTHNYAFHELTFASGQPVFRENPPECFMCHGSTPQPIWDPYQTWNGAYGAFDDKFSPTEFTALQSFIASAPSHPRYQYLQNLAGGYAVKNATIVDGYTTDQSNINRNRSFTQRLYQHQFQNVVKTISQDARFNELKPLVFYFLAKCYRDPAIRYIGDGELAVDTEMHDLFQDLVAAKNSLSPRPYQPAEWLNYLFTHLGADTSRWYLGTHDLPNFQSFNSGTDRDTETFTAYFLQYAPEYSSLFSSSTLLDPDYPIPQAAPFDSNVCGNFVLGARAAAQHYQTQLLNPCPIPTPAAN